MIYSPVLVMNDNLAVVSGNWQEWLTAFAYISFALFIMWRVFNTQPK